MRLLILFEVSDLVSGFGAMLNYGCARGRGGIDLLLAVLLCGPRQVKIIHLGSVLPLRVVIPCPVLNSGFPMVKVVQV